MSATVEYSKHLSQNYLQYALSVITDRAIPDVRDGLKPVQRRILYASGEMGLRPDSPHRKSARIVGEVLGKFHPHGDDAVYQTMVRLIQDFTTRYPLMDGQGNFGSMDGDPPAALRYTEARLSRLGNAFLEYLKDDAVEFKDNFDGSLPEPTVLPTPIPNLLANGVTGIAVGMQTSIPPHNLGELIDALVFLQANPDARTSDLMQFIEGPDFPTGGIVVGRDGILQAYNTGEGTITVRGKYEVRDLPRGKKEIVVTEIPYQVNKASLVEQISKLADDGKLNGVDDVRDESDGDGVQVVIELRRDANPDLVVRNLIRFTSFQQSFSIRMIALVDGRPKTLTLKQALSEFLSFKQETVLRRAKHEVKNAKERLHILEAIKKANDAIDEVIRIIRSSKTPQEARIRIMEFLHIDEVQARAILSMTLQKLIGAEIANIEQEIREVTKLLEANLDIINNEKTLMRVVEDELLEAKALFADERRTTITSKDPQKTLTTPEPRFYKLSPVYHLSVSGLGYIKKHKSLDGHRVLQADAPRFLDSGRDHDRVLLFLDTGEALGFDVSQIEEHHALARGTLLRRLEPEIGGRKVVGFAVAKQLDDERLVATVTRNGYIKATPLSEYISNRTFIKALAINDDDKLVAAWVFDPNATVLLVTEQEHAIAFPGDQVPITGRATRGAIGIRMVNNQVVWAGNVKATDRLVISSQTGQSRVLKISSIEPQNRGGRGRRVLPKKFLVELAMLVSRATENVVSVSKENDFSVHDAKDTLSFDNPLLLWAVPAILGEEKEDVQEREAIQTELTELDGEGGWTLFRE